MRIIGGKDYYDCMMKQFGVTSDDPTVLIRNSKPLTRQDILTNAEYTRQRRDVERLPFKPSILSHIGGGFRRGLDDFADIRPFEIYFAGMYYVGYRVYMPKQPIFTTYSFNGLLAYLARFFYKNDFSKIRAYVERMEWPDIIMNALLPQDREYFIRHKLSIATHAPYEFDNNVTILNGANLNLFSFQMIVNPFDAYRMLETWISNDLACQNDGPDIIDDKIKIQKHGFDLKTSFRHPTK